jgi:hypothetical protein
LGMVVGRTKFLFLLDLFVGTARFRAEVTEGVRLRVNIRTLQDDL